MNFTRLHKNLAFYSISGIYKSAGLTGLADWALTQRPHGSILLVRTDSVKEKEKRPLDRDPTDHNRGIHPDGARSPEVGGGRRWHGGDMRSQRSTAAGDECVLPR